MVQPHPWLSPVGALLGGAAALRASLYRRGLLRQVRLQGRVISVGNLRVGGSGKSPVVAHLARRLVADGHPVSILSRGYGGSFGGACLVVSDGRSLLSGADVAGDEPVMLARQVPQAVVAIGPRRDVVGRTVEAALGPRVHVLDDGFQHLRLARDLDVVCVSLSDLRDRPMPAGWLREGRAALERADVVLLAADGAGAGALEAARDALGAERTFLLSRRARGFFTTEGTPTTAPVRPFLLSGIARPERFAADVPAHVGHAAYADHHRFRAADLEAVVARAREGGADAIVTTEKDLVRLPAVPRDPPLVVFAIDVAVADEPRFAARLRRALA
jgi:tetraacyldisaccharide 4'-kinase